VKLSSSSTRPLDRSCTAMRPSPLALTTC
jgi:hypothetical protein